MKKLPWRSNLKKTLLLSTLASSLLSDIILGSTGAFV